MNDLRRWMTVAKTLYEDKTNAAGIRLIGHGSHKNTPVFDPRNVHPSTKLTEMASPAMQKRLLRLVPAKLVGKVPVDALEEAFQTFCEGHSADNVREIPARRPAEAIIAVQEGLETLAREFQYGTIRLYRGMTVEEGWLQTLTTPGNHLGTYWSWDEQMIMDDLGYDDEEDGMQYEHVELTIDAPPESVDWAETILKTVDGVEREVVLIDGAPVRLRYTSNVNLNVATEQLA